MVRPAVVEPIDLAHVAKLIPAGPRQGPSRQDIADAVDAIVRRFSPERVVLYGSRAAGRPRPDSDVDLMVVMTTQLSASEVNEVVRREVRSRTKANFHVTVRTPDRVKLGLAEGDFFILDAIEQGITLYASNGVTMAKQPPNLDDEASNVAGRPRQATLEWLEKADLDDRMAARALQAPEIWEGVCFHSQQSVEKHLKGLLQELGIPFPRTHELVVLLDVAAVELPALGPLRDDLDWLTDFAVTIRYPGGDVAVGPSEGRRAMSLANDVRQLVREAIADAPR